MKKWIIAIAIAATTTGAASFNPCGKAIAGTLTGLPCCYESNGQRYSSTYGDDNKCKKPSSLPWYKCLIEQAIGVA